MHIVLLCGGAGKRLWPLSGDVRSKVFLPLLSDGQGGKCSMLQHVWRQLQEAGLADVTCASVVGEQEAMLYSQLARKIPVIVEPERRDTFPSVALAAAHLHAVRGVRGEEVICVLPADAYTDASFFARIKQLESIVQHTGADLALIGVQPTYPSDQHGYLVPKSTEQEAGQSGHVTIQSFVEKPDKTLAAKLMTQGAVWNCGVFAFRLGRMLDWLEERNLPLDDQALARQFSKLPKTSFDVEVAEKTSSIVALVHDGSWQDLGTWSALTEQLDRPVVGQGSMSNDSHNTHVINELDIPVNVVGLSNVVVVIGRDGILIADKAASGRIKDMLDRQ